MAQGGGPSISIPVDPNGLRTIEQARSAAKAASTEVKGLQRELEKAARAGQSLNLQTQARLQQARTAHVQAESAVTRFRNAAGVAASAQRRATTLARGQAEAAGDMRQAIGAVRGIAHGGLDFNAGGLRDIADIAKIAGFGGAAGTLEGAARKYGPALIAAKFAYDDAAANWKSEQQSIADARRIQLLYGQGRETRTALELARGALRMPSMAENIQAGGAAGLKQLSFGYLDFTKDKLPEIMRQATAAAKAHPDRMSDQQLVNAFRGIGLGGGSLYRMNGSKKTAEIVEDLRANITSERRDTWERLQWQNRGWTAQDDERALRDAMIRMKQKYGLTEEQMSGFQAAAQAAMDEGDGAYGDGGIREKPGIKAPEARRWRSKRHPYFSPNEDAFGFDDFTGQVLGPSTTSSGIMGWRGTVQAGQIDAFVGQVLGPATPNSGSMTPGAKGEAHPLVSASLMGAVAGALFKNQAQMNAVQVAPIVNDPLAPIRIRRQQWEFGAGRGMAKTDEE